MTHSLLEIRQEKSQIENSRIYAFLQVFAGSLFIALFSQIAIPIGVVPATFQTLAIFVLGLFYTKERAVASVVLYLIEGSLGLPVFPFMSANPLWVMGPTAGYLISFPVAAYVIAFLVEKKKEYSLFSVTASVFSGQVVIYLCGLSWLSMYVGFDHALALGLYPFIVTAALKLAIAVSLKMGKIKFLPN